MEFLDRNLFSFFGEPVTGARLVWAVVWLAAGIAGAIWARAALARRILRPGSARPEAARLILSSASGKILFAGLLAALAALGVNVLPLVWIVLAIGAIGAIVLRDTASQLWAGWMLLWEHPLTLGERVSVGEYTGEVIEIGLRALVLRSDDGTELTVPNSYVMGNAITNWTHLDGGARVCIALEVTPQNDSNRVITALRKAAERNNRILKSPGPKAFMVGFSPRGMRFELRAWVDTYSDVIWATNELCRAAESELKRSRITLVGSGSMRGAAGRTPEVPAERAERAERPSRTDSADEERSRGNGPRERPTRGRGRRRRSDEPDLLTAVAAPSAPELAAPAGEPEAPAPVAPAPPVVTDAKPQPPIELPAPPPGAPTEDDAESVPADRPQPEPAEQPDREPLEPVAKTVPAESVDAEEAEEPEAEPAPASYGRSKRRVLRK